MSPQITKTTTVSISSSGPSPSGTCSLSSTRCPGPRAGHPVTVEYADRASSFCR